MIQGAIQAHQALARNTLKQSGTSEAQRWGQTKVSFALRMLFSFDEIFYKLTISNWLLYSSA